MATIAEPMETKDGVGTNASGRAHDFGVGATEALALDLVHEFSAVRDADELARRVLTRAVVETRSDRGVLSWVEGDEMVVAACHDPFGEAVPLGSRWPLAGEQVRWVGLATGIPALDSLDALNGISPALKETYAGLRHLLVTPVAVGDEVVAIICVSRRRSEQFDAGDTATLELVAAASAQGIRAGRVEEELSLALAELTEKAAGADSVERVKTDILRLASHELRGPLTVLNGYLSLVMGGFFGDVPEPLLGVLQILERRTADMNSLVNDMLVAARVEDIPVDAAAEPVDLRDLLRAAAEAVAPRASAEHVLSVELADEALLARVNPERAELAVRNIIDNAVKYSPGGGDIVCSVSRDGHEACIRVSDTGLGIAPEDRDKLFTRFGRVVTTANSNIPGIGLGLYFSREVARRHGGDVVLLDGEGPGCVFEMTLPLASGPSETAQHNQ